MNDSTKPRTVNDLFPSRFLRADDLQGKVFELAIENVTIEELNGLQGKHWAAILWLKGAKKGLVLNKTQASAMQRISGTDVIERWQGLRISVRPGYSHNRKPTIIISEPSKKEISHD